MLFYSVNIKHCPFPGQYLLHMAPLTQKIYKVGTNVCEFAINKDSTPMELNCRCLGCVLTSPVPSWCYFKQEDKYMDLALNTQYWILLFKHKYIGGYGRPKVCCNTIKTWFPCRFVSSVSQITYSIALHSCSVPATSSAGWCFQLRLMQENLGCRRNFAQTCFYLYFSLV